MIKELLFEINSPSRDSLKVYGFRFTPVGKPKNKIAIVSSLNGDELNQLYLASKLVNYLAQKEKKNKNFIRSEILIIPSVNHFALNMAERFWPLDKTDINAMFPGYDLGETTQRIASKLFKIIQDFDYGILFEDRKDKAVCMPYIKILDSGYEDINLAKSFGLRFIHHKELVPSDSGSLQYNWEVWNTKAFSIVFGEKSTIDKENFYTVHNAILRFLSNIGAIKQKVFKGFESNIIDRTQINVIKAGNSGIFEFIRKPGSAVVKGEIIGNISDSLDGTIKEIIKAPVDGIITCMYSYPLIFQNSVCFRIAKAK